jgi:2-polyprenyl-3-methyl-5-hydroxy-6-metoxy-1,4-benzoquinol methylase
MDRLRNRLHVLWSILTLQSKSCPYCGSKATRRIGSNAHISQVRECSDCLLMYRWPKQTERFNKVFYQFSYVRLASKNMHLPTPEEASELRRNNFVGHTTSLGVKQDIVKLLVPSGRLCVYGANWGYEVAQFSRAGFEATGYELSQPRAEFAAKHLEVSVVSDLAAIRAGGPYNVVYCSHTLEHLPNPESAFRLFESIIAPDGYLVVFVPNCGGVNARKEGVRWGPFSSSLHPLSYTGAFFSRALPNYGFRTVSAFSDPYQVDQFQNPVSQVDLAGDELLIIARKNGIGIAKP